MRAEPKTLMARAEFGERAEALHELRLDAHDPPGVGVHPLGGARGVQQPLVGGAGLHLAPPPQHRPEPLLLGPAAPSGLARRDRASSALPMICSLRVDLRCDVRRTSA